MRKILIIIFFIPLSALPQSSSFDFHSPQNIILFADYLFCAGDYIRAVEEYNSVQNIFSNDTINLKIILCYSKLNLHKQVFETYSRGQYHRFENDAQKIYLMNSFLNDSSFCRTDLSDLSLPFKMDLVVTDYYSRLRSMYFIESRSNEIKKEDLLQPFNSYQRKNLESYIDLNLDPGYKNPALAAIISAIIPGSGKMYVGEWGDGITSLVLTGLFAFLAYDNFKADHLTRAWIFTGIGAFFYAGNIYGSIASTQIFNAKIDFDFNNGIKLFLEKENYFLPGYDFCN